jgi:hypothetical protein
MPAIASKTGVYRLSKAMGKGTKTKVATQIVTS